MIAAAVGLVGLCAASVLLVPRFVGPEAAVRAYFDALADRDADRARTLLAEGSTVGQSGSVAGVDARADLSLLTNSTLANSGYTPPRNVEIKVTSWTVGSASTQVSYDFGGPRITRTLPLINQGGVRGLRSWRITDGLLELTLAHPLADRLVVAGTSLLVTTTRSMIAYPGAYRVTLPEHPLYQAQPMIAFAGGAILEHSSAEVRDDVRRDIEQQVRAHVDDCARRTERDPADCPFRASSYVATVKAWTIIRYPELVLKVVSGGIVSVQSSAQGVATVTLVRSPSDTNSWQESVAFEITGTVRAVDGKAKFSFVR
ncbi:hypothetical protein OG470_09255 [Micromonospora sp. NBC_00389]|uniref:hypothetical protein n=1 Tax=Micromonospora sp. NBC_00389 TaxID=2903586 RepID=UPI002E216323